MDKYDISFTAPDHVRRTWSFNRSPLQTIVSIANLLEDPTVNEIEITRYIKETET
jgi:hypothetical protein